ncbi:MULTISPECIES: hypothetical protein [Cysteiniphilum]|uniref:Uncharacterized protein n=1 Tax=Cysteiniphilum litorale TaxID=2056700 RepID=A0A8J2Z3Y2_9GAMM|nr:MULTISPECIES: hypothetical protein [Cysteiniphilum]GGF93458.1 hypothetical protein GCM10010995_08270 [Cysteiniphilum litorale]
MSSNNQQENFFKRGGLSIAFMSILILSGCGGGGGGVASSSDDATPHSAVSIHISGDNKALLTNQDNRSNVYTIDMRQQGIMSMGGDPYAISILATSDDISISDNHCNTTLGLGGSCQFTVLVNNVTTTPTQSNDYMPEIADVNITATNINTGDVITATLPITLLPDPLAANIRPRREREEERAENHFHDLLEQSWHTENISLQDPSSWRVIPEEYPDHFQQYVFGYNVPFIRTYYGDVNKLPLAMLTRCGNTLIYFVAQQKEQVRLESNDRDSVTVKYHPLIADGLTTGVLNSARSINGTLVLKETGQDDLIRHTHVSAHDSTWSGVEDIDRLKDLITISTSNEDNYLVSILTNISGNPFIDQGNLGATKVITIHSLLTMNTSGRLIDSLRNLDSTNSIATLANDTSLTNSFIINALNEYRHQVAYACYVSS